MIFNSFAFLIFLPLVFSGYWLIGAKGHWRAQNLLVVAASYVFYGWWNWHFLALISITALWAFASGVLLDTPPSFYARQGQGLWPPDDSCPCPGCQPWHSRLLQIVRIFRCERHCPAPLAGHSGTCRIPIRHSARRHFLLHLSSDGICHRCLAGRHQADPRPHSLPSIRQFLPPTCRGAH